MEKPKSILMSEAPETQVPVAPENTNQQDQIDFLMKEITALKNKEVKPGLTSEKEIYSGPRSYSFKTIDSKIISHFEMIKDITNKNLNGLGYNEVQTCRITYTDGTTEEMLYGDFQNAKKSSKKYMLKNIKRQFRFFLKGSNKPTIMNAHEAMENYTKIVRGQQNKVWNYDQLDTDPLKAPTVLDLHTFHILDLDEEDNFIFNDGLEFTVDSTAIN